MSKKKKFHSLIVRTRNLYVRFDEGMMVERYSPILPDADGQNNEQLLSCLC